MGANETGGVFVLCRVGVGGYWDGSSWTDLWEQAVQYPPAPTDGLARASAERDRLNGGGETCCVFYIPLRQRPTTS